MEYLNKAWDIFMKSLESTTPSLQGQWIVMLLSVIVALALVSYRQVWNWAGILVTIYHETGHALAALLTFSRLRGIRIHMDHSGDTQFLTTSFLPFRVFSAWWGYPFPAVAGALYIWAVQSGRAGLALSLTALGAVIVTLQIRNFTALLSIGATAVVVFLAWWKLPVNVIEVPLYFLGWFLIFGGVSSIIELTRHHLRGETENSDAADLRKMTWVIPSIVWIFSFYLTSSYAIYKAIEFTNILLK